jgi:hypothetical protein
MTKEERAIALTLLISFLYGLSFLIQSGVFILPMPLFPLFSLVAGGYICISNFQVSRVSAGLFISALFFKFLLSTFFLMFVLREQSYFSFLKSAGPEVLKLLYYTLIILGCLKLLLNTLPKRRLIYAITFLVIFSLAFQLKAQYLIGIGFVFVFVLTKIEKDELQVFGLIPLLLAVFEFSEWVFTGFVR